MFRRVVGSPLRRIARSVSTLGDLVEQKRYLALTEHKLPPTQVSEISVITDSMNQLIDRVVENEGALAQVNERLEQQVVERTEHLNQALKDLKVGRNWFKPRKCQPWVRWLRVSPMRSIPRLVMSVVT